MLVVRGIAVRFAYRGTLGTTVRVFGHPVDLPDSARRNALRSRGGHCQRVCVGIPSGKMELKTALPNFIQVDECTCECA